MKAIPERLRRSAGGFFAWWSSELAALIPVGVRRVFCSRGDMVVLDEAGPGLVVSCLCDDGPREIARLNLERADGPAAAAASLARLKRLVSDRTDFVVRLREHQTLRKVVELPLAAEENLREVLRFEMARLTPFTVEQVYFAGRVGSRDLKRRLLQVELMLAKRASVDRLLECAASLGIRPRCACPAGQDPTTDVLLDLDPSGDYQTRSTPWGAPSLALSALAAGLALAVIYVPLERKQSEVDALESIVAEAQAEAEAARQLRAEIERVLEESRFAFQRRREAPTVLEVLNELTERLPDETWLIELQLQASEVQISGYSPAASALIGLIEGSSLFQNVRFRSPVTQDTRIGAEQFHLSTELVPQAA